MDPNSLTTPSYLTWVIELLGKGFLILISAFFGTLFATRYQAKKARKIKMEETIGEQKVEAYKKALSLISQLSGAFIQRTHEDAIQFMNEHQRWFSENIILLPHKFVENWRSIWSNLRIAKMKEQAQAAMPDGPKREQMIKEVVELASFMDNLAKEAEKEIRNELGLPQVEIQRPPKAKKG
jgi:hypothetical protein